MLPLPMPYVVGNDVSGVITEVGAKVTRFKVGGVGSVAIQTAGHLGAEVITTTSTDNLAWVKALGADTVIDYKTQKFDELVKDCDLVLDTMGGATREKSYATLMRGGHLVSIIYPPDNRGLLESRQALNYSQTGRAKGKIVVSVK